MTPHEAPRSRLLSDEDIRRIKEANPLLGIVEQHVTLRRSGRSYKGLCPFHDERTPSFHVNDVANTWKCFGCGLGGDVIDFISHIEGGQSFRYAAELLAERSSIEIKGAEDSDEDRKRRELRASIYEINAAAAEYYTSCLFTGDEARTAQQFLTKRHFTSDHAKKYGCGYAPNSGTALTQFLTDNGFSWDLIAAAGLGTATQYGRHYDRFQGRLVWAIRNEFDKVVGFGARRIYDNDRIDAKFINTSETPVYRKSDVLYGYDLARPSIVKSQHVIVVEGYADVMACHAAGITNAVATCGTSFTKEHLRILRRTVGDAGEITFALDDDKAGSKATLAIYDMTQGTVRRLTALNSLGGKDPEEARRFHGDEAVARLVADRVPLLARVIELTIAKQPLETPEDKAYAASEAAALLSHVEDRIARNGYAAQAADLIGVRPGDITSRIGADADAPAAERETIEQLPAQGRVEQNLLCVCALDEATARHYFMGARDLIITGAGKAIAHGIAEAFTAEPGPSWLDRVRAHIPSEADPLLIELVTRGLPVAHIALFDYTEGVIAQLRELRDRTRLATAAAAVSTATDDDAQLGALNELIRSVRPN